MSVLKKITNVINNLYTTALEKGCRCIYRLSARKLLKLHPNKEYKANDSKEKIYMQKWSRLSHNPDKNVFRLFSQYIGPDPYIVPEDVSSSIIQPIMNPITTRGYYADKNMFEKILPKEYLPKALLRKIGGEYYDTDYMSVSVSDDWSLTKTVMAERIFVKPAVDSSSGRGVVCFKRTDESEYVNSEGQKLDEKFLTEYSKYYNDFIVQEGLTQSDYISQFNPTSINTIRIATYRSIKDNKAHVVAIIMRMGKTGSEVDNAHAGGLFIGIDKNGILGKYACDQNGNKYYSFNNLNFKTTEYRIPNFEKVLDFAKSVAEKIPHHRLLAQDIAIQANGEPCLVEFNIRAFAVWLFQFTSGAAFGEYADEIIDYCSKHKKSVNKVIIEPF